jgi:hypothetical protein
LRDDCVDLEISEHSEGSGDLEKFFLFFFFEKCDFLVKFEKSKKFLRRRFILFLLNFK